MSFKRRTIGIGNRSGARAHLPSATIYGRKANIGEKISGRAIPSEMARSNSNVACPCPVA